MKKYLNFIGGEWVAARSGKTYQNRNPADAREIVAEYASGSREDAQEAIQAAAKASPAWSAATAVARGPLLSKTSPLLPNPKTEVAGVLKPEEGQNLLEGTS